MVWTRFKNDQRENTRKAFEHDSKRKTPKSKTEIKMGSAVKKDVTQKEERTWE